MKLINTLKIGKAILLANLFGKRTPINVIWRITNKCNARCNYCFIWKEKHKELTTEQIMSLIDQMARCGTQRIGFVGGEALLRDDFEQIIDYARSKGIYVTLISNGILVPKNMHIIKKVDCLILSFDGRKENHERGRSKGLFDKLMKAFKACKENNIRLITITVLNKYNLEDINYVLNMARDYGFKCNFHVLQGSYEYQPSNHECKKAFDYLIKKKKQGAPIFMAYETMRFLRDWTDYKKFAIKKEIKGFKCWAGKLIFNIDTDGKIAGCDIITLTMKNNPSCVDLGFEKAYKLVKTHGCKACTDAPIIEYNYLFSMNFSVLKAWLKIIFKRIL